MTEYLTLEDVCEVLRISPGTGSNRLSRNDPMPPYIRVGRRRLFPKDQFDLWLGSYVSESRIPKPKSGFLYMPRFLCSLSLPLGVADDCVSVFRKESLCFYPSESGLFFNSLSRFIVIMLSHLAIKEKSLTVGLFGSKRAIMQSFGLSVTGGANGSIVKFLRAVKALERTKILYTDSAASRNSSFFLFEKIAFIDDKSIAATLTENYFNYLLENNTQLDFPGILKHSKSTLRTDIYLWFSSGDIRGIYTWQELSYRFNNGYEKQWHFVAAFITQIEKLKTDFPLLTYSHDSKQLVITKT
jgi:hypothetical protein